ncbi:DNA primase [Cardinium endosymbiont of Tipula unca]|uniref:DNA primase n=1 Tax=Cardinium endosymbiont of Tipula unca TaxID=3066216 RepID=UPI0030D551AC
MRISQQTIQSVQSVTRIEEVIADFISLKKKGQSLWACCPFHHENSPSFSVSPEKGFYKCFGCGAAGDAINFVQQIEGASFVEAIVYLAQKYGITVSSDADFEQSYGLKTHNQKESIHILLNLARDYYSNLLWTHPEATKEALPYLDKRVIQQVIAKKFQLGYSLNSWDGFYKFAVGQGVSLDLLVAAGLVIKSDNKTYDRFRGRIMFPIHNATGQVVAFGARHIAASGVPDSPKYINSPETIVYHKGALLYGLSFAKQRIKQENNCYLVEGYTDVLAFHMAGLEHVVASAGTSLTEEQINYLRRFTTKVTLVFDGDHAGIQAALRGIDGLLAKGFEVKVVLLPSGEDPDSYARKVGGGAFIHYIDHAAEDFITFKAKFLLKQTSEQGPVEQAKCIRDIVQSIVAIPDEIQQSLFLKKCSTFFSIESEVLLATYHELRNKAALKPSVRQQERKFVQPYVTPKSREHVGSKHIAFISKLSTSIEAYEREIMRILLTYGAAKLFEGQQLYEYIMLELGDITFRSADCKMLLDCFKEVLKQGGLVDIQFCLNSSNETVKKIAIDLTASRHEISEAWVKKYGIYTVGEVQNLHQMSLEVMLRLKIRLVQELIEQNREALKKQLPVEEEEQLLQVHQLLKASERNMAKQLGIVVAQ